MSEVKNMALARRLMEARVKGDLDALDAMLAPDFVNHNKLVPGQEPDRENFKRAVSVYHGALGERHLIIEDQIAASQYAPPTIEGSFWALRLAAGR
jgi:ketosteroid isomerase-like protein